MRAGVLLFHPHPERFVTGAYIKVGNSRNDADLVFRDEIHRDAFSHFLFHLKCATEIVRNPYIRHGPGRSHSDGVFYHRGHSPAFGRNQEYV